MRRTLAAMTLSAILAALAGADGEDRVLHACETAEGIAV